MNEKLIPNKRCDVIYPITVGSTVGMLFDQMVFAVDLNNLSKNFRRDSGILIIQF